MHIPVDICGVREQRRDGSGDSAVLAGDDVAGFNVGTLLRGVREHLGLDVAFVAEIQETQRVFRYVDHNLPTTPFAPGDADPLEQSYCYHVVEGRLPQFMRDPAQHPLAAQLDATAAFPVGTHLSVPIRLADGRVYGTFCCFSRAVHESLGEADLRPLRMLAELIAQQLDAVDKSMSERRERARHIRDIINDAASLTMVYQPLVDLATGATVALEALSRFRGYGSPQALFDEAHELGLARELEMKAVLHALTALDELPAPMRLNINVSPVTLVHADFYGAVAHVPPDRLVVEVTEHAAIEDFQELRKVAQRLKRRGIWLSVDDVGMGMSGLNRILETRPDELKLDMNVVRDVDTDVVKQALIEGFASFAHKAGLRLVAEGIETVCELDAVRTLGVHLGQGYFLAKPAPLGQALTKISTQVP